MSTRLEFDLFARDRASGVFNKVGQSAQGNSRLVGGLGRELARMAGPAALGAGLVKTIGLAKDFDLTIRQVGVQTGQTGEDLDELGQLAKKMGADTIYSAQDAGSAMLELAKGGLTAAQIQAGALETALTLAAAGGLDLASSAGYVVQGLSTFGLGAQDAERIAVALAGGANASTASVDSLGQALSQVGPGARNAGMSLRETVAALSAFDSAGIKGSDAGTSLKTMLVNLIPQTENAWGEMERLGLSFVKPNGEFVSMAQVAQRLQDKLGGLTESQRAQTLKTLFGSDATRAATVLMNQGAEGVRKYLGATRDQTTVQDMANTAMDGAAGAWENFTGTLETAAITAGQKLLPTVTDVLNLGSDLINDVSTWGPAVDESFGWMIDGGQALLPVLQGLVDVGGDVIGFIDGLPGPLKETVVQAALAAAVFPRAAAGIGTAATAMRNGSTYARVLSLELRDANTRSAAMSGILSKVGGAARSAAGPAGMLALVGASNTSNDAVSTLLTTAGGFATGFAVGGPIGGAIGGLGGLVYSLGTKFEDAGSEAQRSYEKISASDPVKDAKADLDGLKATLDQVTGAYTENTRAAVLKTLQESGAADVAARYGITQRTLVDAALGQGAAVSRITPIMSSYEREIARADTALKALTESDRSYVQLGTGEVTTTLTESSAERAEALAKEKQAAQQALEQLKQLPGQLQADAAATRDAAVATQILTGKLHGIPANVRAIIEATGIEPTTRGVADVAAAYGLIDKKQIRTLISASGADTTVGAVQKVITKLSQVGKAPLKVDLAKPIKSEAGKAERVASQGGARIAARLQEPLSRAKPNTNGFRIGLGQDISQLTGMASGGGDAIGAAMASGYLAGLTRGKAAVVSMGATIVLEALAAARAAAQTRSPSKKTMKIGHDLARGLEVGAGRRMAFIKGVGGGIAQRMIDGIEAGREGVKSALDRVTNDVQSKVDALNSLMAEKTDFAAGFQSFGGSIFDAEKPERGALTAASMLGYQNAQLARAREAAGAVQRLVDMQLSGTLLKDLQSRGAAGYDQLIALSKGTPSQIAQANANQAAQEQYLAQAGLSAANAIYGGDVGQASRDLALAQMIGAQVAAAIEGRQTTLEFELRGDAIVAAQSRYERQRAQKQKADAKKKRGGKS